jgi:peptidoglycan/LPS O-acetylase OafA/YrhL
VLANLAMLPGILNIVPMITVAWSLSYELAFYLALPLVVRALVLRRWNSGQRIAFFLFLAVAQTVLCVVGISAHLRLIMFAAGIILWEVGRYHSPARKLGAWGEYVAIAAFSANLAFIGLAHIGTVASVLTNVPYLFSVSLFITGFFLTLYTVFFDGILRMMFSWVYLRWVGNMSYSYYLIHGLVLNGIRYIINSRFPAMPQSPLYFIGLFVFCVAATLLAAAILYLLVEKPLSLNTRRRPQNSIPHPQLSRVTD